MKDFLRVNMSNSLFNKPKGQLNAFQKRQLHDVQFSQIKDALRKKNKAKAQAEVVVMEWYVIKQLNYF